MAKFDSIFKDMEIKKTDAHPKRITKWIHYTKLIPNKKQYRDPAQQRKREEALAVLIEADGEVTQDLIVRKADVDEYEIIAGHTRCGACRILVEEEGKKQYEFLPCIVKDISEVRAVFQVYSSNGYSEKTQYEKMHELEEMKYLIETYPEEFPDLQSGRMVERLAKLFHMDKSTVGEYLQISNNLGDEAMELFAKGEIRKNAAVKLSSLDKKEQAQLINSGVRSSGEIWDYKQSGKIPAKSEEEKKMCDVAQKSSDGVQKDIIQEKAHDEAWFVGEYAKRNQKELCKIMEIFREHEATSDRAKAVQKQFAPYGCYGCSDNEFGFMMNGFNDGIQFNAGSERLHMKYGRFVKELEKLFDPFAMEFLKDVKESNIDIDSAAGDVGQKPYKSALIEQAATLQQEDSESMVLVEKDTEEIIDAEYREVTVEENPEPPTTMLTFLAEACMEEFDFNEKFEEAEDVEEFHDRIREMLFGYSIHFSFCNTDLKAEFDRDIKIIKDSTDKEIGKEYTWQQFFEELDHIGDIGEKYAAENQKNQEMCCEESSGYEEIAYSEITIRVYLAEEEKKLADYEMVNAIDGGLPLNLMMRQRILVKALKLLLEQETEAEDQKEILKTEQVEPAQPEFPILKNMEEREAFVLNYRTWPVWVKNELTEETYYRYNLPDGSAIVVREYPYSRSWWKDKEYGKILFLIKQDTKWFKDGETNMTALKEHLKNIQKGGK